MTRSISNDLPGWGVLFHGLVGDGSISVSISTSFNNTVFTKSKIALKWDAFISTIFALKNLTIPSCKFLLKQEKTNMGKNILVL